MSGHRIAPAPVQRSIAMLLAVVVAATTLFVGGADGASMLPATGLYSSVQHTTAQISVVKDLPYGTAVDYDGKPVTLLLDLYLPPVGGPSTRPTIVLIHGGSFITGNKSNMSGDAMAYAQRGYVAASIGYRLDPRASSGDAAFMLAATRAIDDGAEAIRWLKSKASTYRIDTTRIAALGTSAGGAIALGVGVRYDPTPGGPLAAYSPSIAAAVSTGATLTPGLDAGLLNPTSTAAPALMFHYDIDSVTGFTATYAKRTCDALIAETVPCTFVKQSGTGHTLSLRAGGSSWTPQIGPFLWTNLRLTSTPTTTTSTTGLSTTTRPPSTVAPTTTTTRPPTTTTAPPATAPPKVTLHPLSRTAAAGQTVTATAAATGTPAPKVQWQYSSNGGATWANISGATSTTLTITVLSSQNGWMARAVFTNSAGSATTNPAILTVP